MCSETAETSKEAAGAGESSQRPSDTGAGTWESQALSPAVMELHEDVAWLPDTGQFQRGALWICAVSSQGYWENPACRLCGQQSCTMVLILSSMLAPASPQHFRAGAVSWRAQAVHGAHGQCGMSGFSGEGWFGRAPHLAVCMAEGEVEQCPQQAALVAGLGNIIFQLQAGPWRPALTGCGAVVLGLLWLPWKSG